MPLIYFHGVVPGLYVAEWPVYIVGDDPVQLTFTVGVEERRFASLGSPPPETEEAEIRRRYVTRLFRQRLHQREFRERVVRAYQHHCAVCRLRRNELLEAAHIVADADPHGVPSVRNGLALCTLHHAAFDRDVIGITPDYTIEVRPDVLDETDGPMLVHGLQGFHGATLRLPKRVTWRPDQQLLEERYNRFVGSSSDPNMPSGCHVVGRRAAQRPEPAREAVDHRGLHATARGSRWMTGDLRRRDSTGRIGSGRDAHA